MKFIARKLKNSYFWSRQSPQKLAYQTDGLKRIRDLFSGHRPLIFVIAVISFLLPAIWLRDKLVIAYAEGGFPLFLIPPSKLFNLSRYVWWGDFGLGTANVRALPFALYYLMISGLEFLGFSPVFRQYMIFSGIILTSALSMYFLVLEFVNHEEQKPKLVALVASLFYILNPFAMNFVWHRFTTAIFGLPMPPLILLLVVRLFKRPTLGRAVLFAIVVSLVSVNAINPAYFIPSFLPAVLFVMFEGFKTGRLKQWEFLGLGVALTIGFNLWWLLPFAANIGAEYSKAVAIFDPIGTLKATSQQAPLVYILRLLAAGWIHWHGVNYRPGWVEFLIPVLATVPLFSMRRNKGVLLFGTLLVVGLFLGKGLNEPAGAVFEWMFHNIPFFMMFRGPFEKFGPIIALSYSFLIGMAFTRIWALFDWNRVFRGLAVAVALFLLIVLAVWPMWTGDVFSFWEGALPFGARNIPTTKVKVPEYYYQASRWLNKDRTDSRLAFLPLAPFDVMAYNWEYGYWGGDFGSVNMLFNNPAIVQLTGDDYSKNYLQTVFDKIFFTRGNIFPPLLGLASVRYIIVRKDVNETFLRGYKLSSNDSISPPAIERELRSMEDVDKIRSFGQLDIYKLSNKYFVPLVYATTQATFLMGGVDKIVDLKIEEIYPNKVFFLMTAEETKNSLKMEELGKLRKHAKSPSINFKKINPTLYRVSIKNASGPFYLVLSEAFDSGWKAYKGRINWFETLWEKPMGEERHLRANGYANSWYIDDKGDFEMTLFFWPQSLVYLGLILSGITFAICTMFFVRSLFQKGATDGAHSN